jgi:thymidylate kinase
MDMPARGLLMAVEGRDCAGKSSELFNRRLARHTHMFMHFPDINRLMGELIKRYAKGQVELEPHCTHLIYSVNRHHYCQAIIDSLLGGVNVIIERYIHSGIANCARDLPMDWCWRVEPELPLPDLVIYLETSGETCERRHPLRERSQDQEEIHVAFQDRIEANYRLLADERWKNVTTDDKTLLDIVGEVEMIIRKASKAHKISPQPLITYGEYKG